MFPARLQPLLASRGRGRDPGTHVFAVLPLEPLPLSHQDQMDPSVGERRFDGHIKIRFLGIGVSGAPARNLFESMYREGCSGHSGDRTVSEIGAPR